MILKGGMSIYLLFMISFKLVNTSYWRTTKFSVPITKQFVSKFRVKSFVSCVVHCSTYFSSSLVTIRDGDCYCLTSDPDLNLNEGEVTLTTFMSRRSDESDCLSKGYEIHRDLGVCIKLMEPPKTWLEAERRCNQDGGYLLNMDTPVKLIATYVIMIRERQGEAFVGGISTFWDGSQTKFYWTRGGEITDFWLSSEPTFTAVEPCIAVHTGHGQGLNNLGCSELRPFLCELLIELSDHSGPIYVYNSG